MLSGSIPGELGNLNKLYLLALSNNNLSGCFDQNLSALCANPISSIGYNNDFVAEWEDFCLNGSGVCAEGLNCAEYLFVGNTIASDKNKQANNYISSDAKILSGTTNFYAGQYIELTPDFEVIINTTFLVDIQECE